MIPSRKDWYKKCGVYCFVNKQNWKRYIGETLSIYNRYIAHKGGNSGARVFINAIKKYGFDGFDFEVLEECLPEIRKQRESYWIKFYDTINRDKGYNLVSENERESIKNPNNHKGRGRIITQETRKKLSESHKGQISICRKPIIAFNETETIEFSCFREAETKYRYKRDSIRNSIRKNYKYRGYFWKYKFDKDNNLKPNDNKTKEQDKRYSQENIERMREWNKKLAETKKGEKHPNSRKVIAYNKNDRKEFVSLTEAAKNINGNCNSIMRAIKRDGPYKNYFWKYKYIKETKELTKDTHSLSENTKRLPHNIKPVVAYNDKEIKNFDYIGLAAKEIGGNCALIIRAIKNNKSYKNYLWAYKYIGKTKNLTEIIKRKVPARGVKKKRAVIAYNGIEQKEYIDPLYAAQKVGCHYSAIYHAIRNKHICQGMYWMFKFVRGTNKLTEKLDLTDKPKIKLPNHRSPIIVYNEKDNLKFCSIAEAGRKLNIHKASIGCALKSQRLYKGFYWKYAENEIENETKNETNEKEKPLTQPPLLQSLTYFPVNDTSHFPPDSVLN